MLEKYIKSKNEEERWIVKHNFLEYFEDIPKELREEILKYTNPHVKFGTFSSKYF